MACPCRVVLAAISAFVAVFLVWHVTRDSSQQPGPKQDGKQNAVKGESPYTAAIYQQQAWRTALDMFTGKFLWDVSTAYREQRKSSRTKGLT